MKITIGIIKVYRGKLIGTEVRITKSDSPIVPIGMILTKHKEDHWIVCQGDKSEVGKLSFELIGILNTIQFQMINRNLSLEESLEFYANSLNEKS